MGPYLWTLEADPHNETNNDRYVLISRGKMVL
jgi:hypothetical protein